MIILFEFILQAMDLVLYYLLFQCFLEKRKWVNRGWTAAGVGVLAVLDFGSAFIQNQVLSVSVNTVIVIVISFLFFGGSLFSHFLLIILGILFSFILENLFGFLAAWSFGIEANVLIDHPHVMSFAIVLYLCAKLCILFYINKRKKEIHLLEHHAISLKTLGIPFLSFIGGTVFFYVSLMREEPEYGMAALGLVFLVLINAIYYFVLEAHAKLYQDNYQHLVQAREYEMKEDYYRNIERYQQEVRTIKHDLKNQLLTIGAYIEKADDKTAGEQLEKIMSGLQDGGMENFTRHPGLNMLLNAKWKRAQESRITCDFDIKVPENIKIEEKDLGSLIGNVLDNSLESCRKCEGRAFIQLKMVYFKKSLVVQAENSTDGKVKDLRTRKGDTVSHGLGTKSIRSIVEKYKGNMDYEIGEKSFQMNITLWEGM